MPQRQPRQGGGRGPVPAASLGDPRLGQSATRCKPRWRGQPRRADRREPSHTPAGTGSAGVGAGSSGRRRLMTGRSRCGARGNVQAPSSDRATAGAVARRRLRPRLEHQVERRLGRAAEAGEAAGRHDVADPRLAGLGAEREPDLLRQRRRACTAASRSRSRRGPTGLRLSSTRSPARGSTIIHVPSGGERARARAGPRRPGRPCRAGSRTSSRGRSRRRGSPRPGRPRSARGRRRRPPRPARARSRSTRRGSRSRRSVEFGNACAIRIVEAPWPQPTSATRRAALELVDDAVERGQPRRRRGARCSRGGRSARSPSWTSWSCSCQPTPSPVRAASVIRGESSTEPSAIWKKPGRKAGLSSSVSATACSGGSV